MLNFSKSPTDIVKKDAFLSKSLFVLRALKILGLDEMLKLSEVLHVKQAPLKKAAGEELVVWDDSEPVPKQQKRSNPEKDAKVLEFPKKTIADMASVPEPHSDLKEGEDSNLLNSEVVLWQKEISRQAGDSVHKKDAFKGYKKSTEMYVVKTSDIDGKDKIRFASTNGVLVNKKQA